jgi:plasmid stabilization system protein ParE
MSYRVVITPAAEEDLAEAFAYIHARSPMNAEKWLRALLRAVHDLEGFAGYGRARESDYLDADLRQKVFKSHRIVFSVDDKSKVVTVHYVRYGARRAAGEPDEDERE